MKSSVRFLSSAASIAASLAIATTAFAVEWENDFGIPGDPDMVARNVTIKPNAQWVNVIRGETVKVIDEASGKSFVWKFDTAVNKFDLGAVAPAAGLLNGRRISAYVSDSAEESGAGAD